MKKQLLILLLLGYHITKAQNYISLRPAILSENPTGLNASSTDITNPPTALVSGAGTRMMWIPSRSAFRVGSVYSIFFGESVRWDASNIGLFSFASGANTQASGQVSTSMGYGNIASGDNSTSLGTNTTASGQYSISMGLVTTASGQISTSLGSFTTASGQNSTSMGDNTTAQAYASTVLGRYNVIAGTTGSWVNTDPLFVVGNGTDNANRNNALTVLKNGNIGINKTNPQEQLHVNGGVLAVNTSTVTTDPGAITLPVSGAGTRMMWIPAKSAFRVGTSGSIDWDASNIGVWSFASGYGTRASGQASTSLGYGTIANGAYALSTGQFTTASGNHSTSMGYNTTSSGNYSVSIGFSSISSGNNSTSIGDNTVAQAYLSTVLGRYNVASGTNGSWIVTEPLFVIGNGTSVTANNALTVLKNANVGINIADPHAPLQFSNALTNRKIVFYETGNNDNQFYGLGIQGATLRYQVDGTSSNHVFYAATGAGTSNELCRIQGNGNMVVAGTVTASGSVLTSDIRLKKDFTRLNSSLSKLYKIDGYHYFWKDETKNKDLQTGVIAQEVEKIFPELVQTDDKGYKSVNYIGLIPHLIEAVKELKNENKDLKELKNENKELKNRLEKIEALLSASTQNTGK